MRVESRTVGSVYIYIMLTPIHPPIPTNPHIQAPPGALDTARDRASLDWLAALAREVVDAYFSFARERTRARVVRSFFGRCLSLDG